MGLIKGKRVRVCVKKYFLNLLSILFILTSCNPYTLPTLAGPDTLTPLVTETVTTKTIEPTDEFGNKKVILDFALSPDGTQLAIYLNTGVYIYDVKTLNHTTFSEFESEEYYSEFNSDGYYYPPFGAPGAVAFSPDGKELAISGKFQDELIHVWDWKNKISKKVVFDYPNGNFVRGLEYSSDGNVLLIRSTYPLSRLHCEVRSEDSLTLISLKPKKDYLINKLFEMHGCNQFSLIEYYFSTTNTMYFFHFGESGVYLMYEVEAQTGDILQSDEIDVKAVGVIYDVSQDGKVFAAVDHSNLPDGVLHTVLRDSVTKDRILSISGSVALLKDKNRFLIYTPENKFQLRENNNVVCEFDGLEYLFLKINRENNTMAVITRDESIQIWNIPDCKLINIIPIN